MKKIPSIATVLFFGVSLFFTLAANAASAQGPSGSGASAAAQNSSHGSISANPLNWVKKDSKSSDTENRTDVEKKLTPNLQSEGLLAAGATTTSACQPFTVLIRCLAALHASRNLGVNFDCMRATVTGVNTGLDLSSCKVADEEKAQNLDKAIHQLKPDANAKQSAKDAEQQANDDLKKIGD